MQNFGRFGPKLHNCLKRGFLGENWLMLPLSIYCVPSRWNVSKKKKKKRQLCDRSWDIRFNNFGPNWVEIILLLERMIFWENWLILPMPTYCASLCHNVLKKSLEWGRYGLQFWAKLDTNPPFTLKGDFFFKYWLALILSTSCTPIPQFFQKNIEVDHKIQGCIIFGQAFLGYFLGKGL